MASLAPIFASEAKAAALLDMKRAEFADLVNKGHLPKGKVIAPGFVRWDVETLRWIIAGEAVEDLGGVQW